MASRNEIETYIADVISGKQVVSQLVRQAVKRHLDDLQQGHERGLAFDPQRGIRVVAFIERFIPRTDQGHVGEQWIVEPWMSALIHILYGWYWRETGLRRFKFAYVEVSRGNMKSTLASALATYELITNKGANVYSASTDRATARVVFDTAAEMVNASAPLKSRINVLTTSLTIRATASRFLPVSSDGKSVFQASRPTFVTLDELHLHPDAKVWTAFYTALDKVEGAWMLAITNSGWDKHSIAWRQREYVSKVLSGIIPDDRYLGWVCGLDPEDVKTPTGWLNEANWIKANPSLGVAHPRSTAARSPTRPASRPVASRYSFRKGHHAGHHYPQHNSR